MGPFLLGFLLHHEGNNVALSPTTKQKLKRNCIHTDPRPMKDHLKTFNVGVRASTRTTTSLANRYVVINFCVENAIMPRKQTAAKVAIRRRMACMDRRITLCATPGLHHYQGPAPTRHVSQDAAYGMRRNQPGRGTISLRSW